MYIIHTYIHSIICIYIYIWLLYMCKHAPICSLCRQPGSPNSVFDIDSGNPMKGQSIRAFHSISISGKQFVRYHHSLSNERPIDSCQQFVRYRYRFGQSNERPECWQDTSTFRKGGAVETGCSDLYDVVY